jgi:glycosyltransferase involved in cell wall biosynthesis
LPSIGIVMHDFALGGTERIATRLAARWAAEGATVRIFCGSGEGDMRALLGDQVEVVEASPPIARGFGSRTALGRAAARHFDERPVDVVFLPGNFHWPIAPALAALPRDRRPAIAAQVSATLSKPQRRPIQQKLFEWRMRHLLRDTQAVMTLSAAATEEAERILGRSVVCTIPLPALSDARIPPQPVPEDSRIVLAVGRLVPEKGFDALIEAFAALPDRAAELVIVGEGPDRERLEGLIARYHLTGRVTLPGFVSDTRGWLNKARLAAMPSRFEGYPAVLVEAFAAGRPAVATACTPATAELIDTPAAGRVVAIDDCAGMTAALQAVLDSPIPDPARLAARVERHRIGPVARAYLALFQGLSVAAKP